MHYVIIWQNDPEIEQIFKPLIDRGAAAGISTANGYVRLFRMLSAGSPKGESYDALPIFSAIFSTADHALQNSERRADLVVMFVFHQTSRAAVRSIMGALKLLTPDALDGLAASYSKDLSVSPVVLLSCESGCDKAVTPPVPPLLQPWVNQARDMRSACFEAFRIRRVSGPGEFVPQVVTFSTGNAETGGITLDPWRAQFMSLNGHFTADGGWDYNTDASGQPDHTKTPTGGTVHVDTPPNTVPAPAPNTFTPGQPIPPLLPPFSP